MRVFLFFVVSYDFLCYNIHKKERTVLKMSYKTELHCHSRTVSDCASITPAEIVEKYLAAGYTTVVLADHLSPATFAGKRYTGGEDWQKKIDYYMEGVRALREAAAGKLHILQGCELRIEHCPSDFLVYGMTEDFMRQNEDLLDPGNVKKMCGRLHQAGALVYQAHPFRNGMNITDPTLLDGIEVYNAHCRHKSRNSFAELWAESHSLSPISGSDVHDPTDPPGGGILTDEPIESIEQLMQILRAGDYTLLREGSPGDGSCRK